jgi:formate-dependent nitrite reductase cytochrome c552 subunit
LRKRKNFCKKNEKPVKYLTKRRETVDKSRSLPYNKNWKFPKGNKSDKEKTNQGEKIMENKEMIEKTCSLCHTDLEAEVRGVQAEIVKRTTTIGKQLAVLTDELAVAVESGKYTDDELAEVRQLARDAQFYWDFVFVENSEGVHNPALARDCLNRAESLGSQAALALVALTT